MHDLDAPRPADDTLVMVWASSAGRRRSTRTPAAITGRRCSASCSPAAASRRARVYGSSDPTASEPQDDPLTVEDLAYTVYHCSASTPDKKLMAPGNRPIDIVDDGQVRKDLLGVSIAFTTEARRSTE